MELTEALSHLPAGGQVLLSDTTSRHTAGRLHHIHLPAFTFQCSRSSLEGASRASLEGLRSVYTKQLVTVSQCCCLMHAKHCVYTRQLVSASDCCLMHAKHCM